ncbi:16780_t:CDS:2 [Entrophospora sp. SA101]|nr:16780_t:CDS:2 [Entrophospora sp. SA101]
MATIIPSEIFIKICSYLSPSDLYSLTTVCKNYRSMLWSFTSTTTQSIWCNSREQFISHLTLPPPKDMSEQHRDTLLKEWELPDILITCFTSLPPNAQRPQLFLISEIIKNNNYNYIFNFFLLNNHTHSNHNTHTNHSTHNNHIITNIDEEDINNNEKLLLWIKSNQEEIALLKSQNKRYIFQHDEGRYDHNEQLDRLFNTLNMSIEYNIKINDSRRNSRSLMDDDIDELLS